MNPIFTLRPPPRDTVNHLRDQSRAWLLEVAVALTRGVMFSGLIDMAADTWNSVNAIETPILN